MEWHSKLEKNLKVRILDYKKKFSFRNNVYLVDTINRNNIKFKYLLKEYVKPKAGNEVFIVNCLKKQGLMVPKIIWNDNHLIIMEYIEGVLLTDLLDGYDKNNQDWVNDLVLWLYKLHSIMKHADDQCLCKSDLNLRNFIYTSKGFYGIDFEEVCFYPPERDLGGLCAFILMNDPMFEQWKFKICKLLVNTYKSIHCKINNTQINNQAIKYYLLEELKAAAARREKQRSNLLVKIEELRKKNIGI